VLFAPGLGGVEEIRAVCEAVSKPVNVLAVPGLSVAQIAEAGAQRISVGGGLTRIAIDAMAAAATTILDSGDLSVLAGSSPFDRWLASG
jgi:2-methylisocitrate lyase-like PEP mutase family enzyme